MVEKREAQLRLEKAEELFLIIPPEEEVSALATPNMSTINFINKLIYSDLFIDAIRYLAIALPRREAIWWACATNRSFPENGKISERDKTAWKLVEDWVYNPSEEIRAQTLKIAEELGFETPGSYGAMGVFWSGGSMVPPETGQFVPPPATLTGSAIGASIIMNCAIGDPQLLSTRQKSALEIGLDVAYGGNGLSRVAIQS